MFERFVREFEVTRVMSSFCSVLYATGSIFIFVSFFFDINISRAQILIKVVDIVSDIRTIFDCECFRLNRIESYLKLLISVLQLCLQKDIKTAVVVYLEEH